MAAISLAQHPSTPPEGSLHAAAVAYATMGWHVIPIWDVKDGKCGCGREHCQSPGKHPVAFMAPGGQKSASTDRATIDRWWTQKPDANIAIYAQESGLCVIDIDPRNGGDDTIEDFQNDYGRLDPAVIALTGGGGQHWLFEAPAGTMPGKLGPGVDIKLDGYFVVEPSTHISGRRYYWDSEADPLQGCLPNALPPFMRDMQGNNIRVRADGEHVAGGIPRRVLDEDELRSLRRAWDFLDRDDRDDWLRVGFALKRDVVSDAAFDLWVEWSDPSPKFNPEDQIRVWNSMHRNSIENSMGVASIYREAADRKEAAERGITRMRWDSRPLPEPSKTVLVPTLATARIQPAKEPQPIPRAGGESILRIQAFPCETLNAVTKWLAANQPSSHPVANQVIVLSVLSTAVARRYRSTAGDALNLFLAPVVPSASQGRYIGRACESLLTAAGLSDAVMTTQITSLTGLRQMFMRYPSMCVVANDWAEQIRLARRQPSGAQFQIHNEIAGKLFDGDNVVTTWPDLGQKASDQPRGSRPILHSPAMTMVSPLAAANVPQVLTMAEIARGAVDQMLLPPCNDEHWIDRPAGRPEAPPRPFIERIAALTDEGRQRPAAEAGNLPSDYLILQPPEVMSVIDNAGSAAIENQWIARQRDSHRSVSSVVFGGRGAVRRVAALLSVWMTPEAPAVTPAALQWADQFVTTCIDYALGQIAIHGDNDGKEDVLSAVARVVGGAMGKGIAAYDLPKFCKAFRKLKTDERTDTLDRAVADGLIVECQSPGGRSRRFVTPPYVQDAIAQGLIFKGLQQFPDHSPTNPDRFPTAGSGKEGVDS